MLKYITLLEARSCRSQAIDKDRGYKCIPQPELSCFFMGYKGFASLQVRPQQVRPYHDQLSPSPLCLSYLLLIKSVSKIISQFVQHEKYIQKLFFFNSNLSPCAPKPMKNKKQFLLCGSNLPLNLQLQQPYNVTQLSNDTK